MTSAELVGAAIRVRLTTILAGDDREVVANGAAAPAVRLCQTVEIRFALRGLVPRHDPWAGDSAWTLSGSFAMEKLSVTPHQTG